MKKKLLVSVAGLVAFPAAAQQYVVPPPAFPAVPDRSVVSRNYVAALTKLRNEAVTQQQVDGGALSQVSRTRLQTRLDRIERKYRRQFRDANRQIITVSDNSWG